MFKATSSVVLACLGFRLKIEGEVASRDDAPVVICAPHTSFLDVFVIAVCRGSPVARIENSKTPGMSAIQTVGHTIFVDRRSDQSRHAALENIVARAISPLSWPKVSTANIQHFHHLNLRCSYSRKEPQLMARLLLGFKLVDFRLADQSSPSLCVIRIPT
jgi:hypothetical protein